MTYATITRHDQCSNILLRSLRDQSGNRQPGAWPAAVVLRRWLRRPGFRAALQSMNNALVVQADLQLSAAAAEAASKLREFVAPPSQADRDDPATDISPPAGHDVNESLRILRSAHLRQRFMAIARLKPANDPESVTIPIERLVEESARLDPRRYSDMLVILPGFKPEQNVGEAIKQIEDWMVGRTVRVRRC